MEYPTPDKRSEVAQQLLKQNKDRQKGMKDIEAGMSGDQVPSLGTKVAGAASQVNAAMQSPGAQEQRQDLHDDLAIRQLNLANQRLAAPTPEQIDMQDPLHELYSLYGGA